jgi:hypothetical protein
MNSSTLAVLCASLLGTVTVSAQEPASDCIGAIGICDSETISANPSDVGNEQDLDPANRGCLVANEHQGVWFRFTTDTAGTLAITIDLESGSDYDFAVWGPYTDAPPCPPTTPPLRCSWAGLSSNTGLSYIDADLTEGAGGNGWVRYIDVLAQETYLLYIDNYSMNGLAFDLVWDNEPDDLLDCLTTDVTPVPGNPDQLSVRPNPAQDQLFVTTNLKGMLDVRVHDASGRLVMREQVRTDATGSVMLDLGTLAEGIHTVLVTDTGGATATVRFAKHED